MLRTSINVTSVAQLESTDVTYIQYSKILSRINLKGYQIHASSPAIIRAIIIVIFIILIIKN